MVNRFDVFSITRIGESHVRKSKPCQDSSSSEKLADGFAVCVSDGHGGSDYFRSDRGSRFACEAFLEAAKRNHGAESVSKVDADALGDTFFRSLTGFILSLWHDRISEDLVAEPIRTEELNDVSDCMRDRYLSGVQTHTAYGATLIGAVVCKGFWYGIQIGDGELICVSNNAEWSRPIPEDDKCVGSVTTSLCDDNAVNEFRWCFSDSIPEAVFVATDGVDKSFGLEQTDEIDSFYDLIIKRFQEQGRAAAIAELSQFLPILSKKGSGDDVSISGVVRHRARSAKLLKDASKRIAGKLCGKPKK